MAKAQARPPGVEARAGKFPGPSLIPALHAIQERVGWLPREELVALSRDVRRPLYEIEGLISFYPHFRTGPPKPVAVHACRDLACWLQGADKRIAALRQRHGPDAETEIVEVSCLGRCDAAPAVSVNECPVTAGDADTLIAAARDGELPPAAVRGYASGDRWPNDPYGSAAQRYGVLRAVLAGDLDSGQVITALQDAGLRGMGGAGFPTGRKWDLVAAQDAEPKYVICNADESEPGTFKDRQILAEQPHLVLEGMLLGMLAVGAAEGWVFIRHEYGPEEAVVRREIEALRAAGLVGADAAGSGWGVGRGGFRPARVGPGGGGGPPGERGAARRRAGRGGRRRYGPAAVGRGVHLAGRVHPGRGVGADRVHGGTSRGAAQQTAVPGRLRPARPADPDELGGDRSEEHTS